MIVGLQVIALLFAFSIVMWTVAIIIIIFPELLQNFAKTFLVTRVFDLMVIGGFILTISMIASAYLRTKKYEKKLEELVRKLSLKKNKK